MFAPVSHSPLDNAVIEAWHSTVEFELRRLEHFTTKPTTTSRNKQRERPGSRTIESDLVLVDVKAKPSGQP
jgi:hypothetical protein